MPETTRAPRGRSARRRTASSTRPKTETTHRATTSQPATPRPPNASTFTDLGVPERIVAALDAGGVTTPFPIQAATLPDALAGRDVLGRGETGSGKSIAFAVPTVAALARSDRARSASRPRALVLVPTRELANQVSETFRPMATAVGLKLATVYGGVGQNPQVSKLRSGVDVLVACPGRLEDLIGQGHCDLGSVEVTVLDEADHMADLGFLPAVRRLLDQTPQRTQRLLFSATLDNGVDTLVRRYLDHPVSHSVAPSVSPVTTMTHHVLAVEDSDKKKVVQELTSGQGRTLLFSRTKHAAKKLAQNLTATGIPAVDLHGNLSQAARQRNLAAFSTGEVRVLVATDIAARGIHVDDVALVVHVDPPAEHKAYLHRSGRTARAGAEGTVVTVMTPAQARDVRTLTRHAGITPITTRIAPGDPLIETLTGPKAPVVEPAPAPAGQAGRRNRREPARAAGSTRKTRRTRPAAAKTSGTKTSGTKTSGPKTSDTKNSVSRTPARKASAADFSSSARRRRR